MSQRHSEYARIDGDFYQTPVWVWEALHSVEPWSVGAFDCAPCPGSGYDFLSDDDVVGDIATNPPFKLATEFIRHAIGLDSKPRVAMLLPHTFDTAKGRRDVWGMPFKAKYTITTRIRWANLEQKESGPSTNHSWYIWDWGYTGKPFMGWLP